MGQVIQCVKHGTLKHHTKAPDTNNASGEAPKTAGTQTHVIIVALDYEGTGHELTCTQDGDNMKQLLSQCGVDDITSLYNNDGNKDQVTQAIQDVGSRCGPGDYFIFYYSGHGATVPDKDGDEADGKDECLCLVTTDGRIDWDFFMTDDEFCDLVTSSVSPEAKVLVLCDCCHSGTIGDFDDAGWGGFHACSISGCTDDETSGDTGRGGIFTHSMLLAIQDLQEQGNDDYSVGQLYNLTLDKDDSTFDSAQDITANFCTDLGGLEDMAWPLIPDPGYTAPWGA